MKSRPDERTSEPGVYRRGNRYVVIYRDHTGRQRPPAVAADQLIDDRPRRRLGGDGRPGEQQGRGEHAQEGKKAGTQSAVMIAAAPPSALQRL